MPQAKTNLCAFTNFDKETGMTRYINQFPDYLSPVTYSAYEEAREACANSQDVKTIKLISCEEIVELKKVMER